MDMGMGIGIGVTPPLLATGTSGSTAVLQKVFFPVHLGSSKKTWWLEHRKSCTRYGREFNRQILCEVVLRCKSDRGKLATCNLWAMLVGNRQARQERLGSRFAMATRFVKLKQVPRAYVGKRR